MTYIPLAEQYIRCSSLALACSGPIEAVAFSENGETIVTYACRQIQIWKNQKQCMAIHVEGLITCLSILPDARMIIWGTCSGHIEAWEVQGDIRLQLNGHQGPVSSISPSRDSRLFASGSFSDGVRIWSSEGDMKFMDKRPAQCVAIFENSVAWGSGRRVMIFNGKNLVVAGGVLGAHFALVNDVSFSPNGSVVVSGSEDGSIRFWDSNEGIHLGAYALPSSRIFQSIYSPDGRILASRSNDKTVRLWTPIASHRTVFLRYLTEFRLALFGGAAPLGKMNHDERLVAITFCDNGETLMSISANGQITKWSLLI